MIKILGINILLSFILYIIMKLLRKNGANTILLISLSIPYVGFIILLFILICEKLVSTDHGREVLKRESKYEKSISLLVRAAELEHKKDLIAAEEALILNSNSVKRELIKDILKKDTYKYRTILLNALMDEDTETSHYAATAITQMKGKLTILIQKFEAEYEKNPKNQENANMFLKALKDYIESNIIDSKEIIKLKYMYRGVLEEYKQNFEFTETHFEELIKTCINLKEYKKALDYNHEFKEKFKDDIKPYILLLEIYYYLKDKKSFNDVILEIRNSSLKLDNYSLDLLRFWIEEEKDV
ncbi:hypothetical protein LI058_09850 [Clostridium perfringens]|uniref:hypothetical protein n=2 Tax=Clostridium perfringens TaxID=1502 RepID=UPI0010E08602|nr:hypothetical protein [Clostridium perfringens]EHK2348030.1 hypothetical protein [Clostridium perfringens]MCX0373771.1 hypothetical protein [Clostridium perfringens]VTQ57838.1 membrane protein [Clostridium perfringens]